MSAQAQAIGWGVVHSVWQGTLAAGALGLVLCATRSARARYALACAALLSVSVAFAYTVWRSIPDAADHGIVITARGGRSGADAGALWLTPRDGNVLEAMMPWVAAFWAAGVVAFQLRAAANWRAARRLRIAGVCAPPAPWVARMEGLARQLRVPQAVALLESGLADVPAVVGYLRPVILMPVGMLTALPASQVEAILMHELAHIRRRDYLVNVLQSVAEAVFFYHPAAWWISSVIRAEREHCCDDLAAAAVGDAHEYAAALAALEQNRWSADPAVAATGGNLMKRVRRLLRPSEGPRVGVAPVIGAAVLAVAAGVALFGWQSTPAQEQQDEAASPYVKWLQMDVAYIVQDQERAAFKALTTDEEREKFIEQFWLRRDPTPGTPENEFKEEHYRRIAYANQRFTSYVAGWKTDRGRIYIIYGPPDEIESHPKGNQVTAYPYEEWLYRYIEGIGNNVIVRFEDPNRTGEFRQTLDPRTVR
jgi:GWxTD domain-containing protein